VAGREPLIVPSLGYSLSSEEFDAPTLVALAERAERAGFDFAGISDHFHPWVDAQGESPFVWGVLGAIAARTERLELLTGVTCPTQRIHPALVAQAAATAAQLLPGRFSLGVGTGENLNEHVLGDRWPLPDERLAMLEEAVAVMRLLWRGGEQTHRGTHYTVDHARLYTLPEQPVPVYVSGFGPQSTRFAAEVGDAGLSNTKSFLIHWHRVLGRQPDSELTIERAYDKARPRIEIVPQTTNTTSAAT